MAVIASTAARISRIMPQTDEVYNFICGVAITAGQAVHLNSSGNLILSNGGAAGTAKCVGIALESGEIGQAISVLKSGWIAGFTLAGAYGDKAYLSNTAGAVDDAAGTVSVVIGSVLTLADRSRTKVLYIDANWLAI